MKKSEDRASEQPSSLLRTACPACLKLIDPHAPQAVEIDGHFYHADCVKH